VHFEGIKGALTSVNIRNFSVLATPLGA